MARKDIQPYDPGLPDLHPDPAQWSHDEFVAAWQENDDRSTWNRALLATAYQGAHGDLKRYADAVGASCQTLKNYRSVVKAYAELGGIPKSTDVGTFPFGVADALRGQQDRLELVRREQPWSVEEARLLVQSRRVVPRPRTVVRGTAEPVTPVTPEPGSPGPVAGSMTTSTQPASNDAPAQTEEASGQQESTEPASNDAPEPQPCPRCAPQIADLEARLKDASADLEKAHGQIQRLRDAHPDTVMAAELESVTADRDRLRERVTELEQARPSAALDGHRQAVPVTAPQQPGQAADGAHGEPQVPSGLCAQCGRPGLPVLVDGEERVLVDGEERVLFACDPCFRKARAKGQPLSRPEAVYAPSGGWDSL
jgi:hypothetical protein